MIENKVLYKKQRNRYLNDMRNKLGAFNPMTLIFGARCVDGVILVSDRLVKSGENIHYTDKLRRVGGINWAVFGAAGLGTLFEEFLTVLP